ncbi:AAA family ATPase [Balneolaceae bacterium ANBcel3]|nr:AAA family ATPase [Balneolaceae bacterium ANBcel3]
MSRTKLNMEALTEQIRSTSAFIDDIHAELEKVIIGQKTMVNRLLIGMLANGHILLEGVPGLAKTLTISSLAKTINTGFQRIQFTPDLLPADLIGTLIFNQKTGDFTVKKGPVFSNIILADEINRSPAKVQSALLEAMQERQVTIGEETFPLPEPFLVLATQNPVEQEGTYPLPEAQVDRFMLKIKIDYPTGAEEMEIMRRMAQTKKPELLSPVIKPKTILNARNVINDIYMDEKVEQYIIDIIMATRYPARYNIKKNVGLVDYGASPRGTINLNLASRAHAFCQKRAYVTPEDIRAVAYDVLRHRIVLTYEAEAEEIRTEDIIETILGHIQVP